MGRTAFVTGATSGIGKATAAALLGRGYHVIGTSRTPARTADPLPGVEYVELDLTSPESVESVAEAVATADVLVNNAGESQSGPIEELPADAVARLFQTNVFGPLRLTQLATPAMRDRGYGRVVMVGSMLASFPLAYRSSYVASKAALRGFADAARHELSPFGVWVTTVEPGAIATGISDRRTSYLNPGSPHERDFTTMLNALRRNEEAGTTPAKVAQTIVTAIEARRPKRSYAIGSGAPYVFAVRRLAPAGFIEKLTQRRHDLQR
ncbi:SDR family oxidoreductase [Actinoplanes sp. N902-109]|uniref:SDR family oxidoreductase n=1 Tax=Actinoplanes sp. (strain N902-109) TaxID=649831 RepID=UPI0003293E7C|nr:SDR family oxidoreductase [Actinoplanes sp. N902-109]AGL15194.1 short-chain dehydrogenase/reductase SDR [Actinoplanes sp. N902-109]